MLIREQFWGCEMQTEEVSSRFVELDAWDLHEMIAAMYEGQLAAAAAVQVALGDIARAVDDFCSRSAA